jgi:ATP-dependent Lhr-like helicase
VGDYRPELLDALLGTGKYFWRLDRDAGLRFHPYDDIDWDAAVPAGIADLNDSESRIVTALSKRGASFAQRLLDLTEDGSPYDALLSLAEKGVVTADSFVPVRQLLVREKIALAPVKRRIKSHVLTMTAGRWELSRPLLALSLEQRLERLFDRAVLVCRETVEDLGWSEALGVLRVWEFTGRVRRGYFIEGLSGMQFIRDREYAGITAALEVPDSRLVWLPAVDPAQPWGKSLKHPDGRSFLNVPGTAVALASGLPVAVFERQGRMLRVFDPAALPEALGAFVRDFTRRRLFPGQSRLTVQHYPPESAQALSAAGFVTEMRDYVLYRGIS